LFFYELFSIIPAIMGQIRSFARRKGQITAGQKRALQDKLARVIPLQDNVITYAELFGDNREVILEVGFGMGLATALIAQNNPHKGYIGVEVYEPGVGKLLLAIARDAIENIYIINDDITYVLPQMIAPASLSGIHVFFPDPWPKKRHHKRRLLNAKVINDLALRLKTGGYLYVVSDWQNYAEQVLVLLRRESLLKNAYESFAPAQEWRPITRFNEKADEAGRDVYELWFIKI
jgi:tRNA (guanine-N7-)-methyltransferase